LSVLDRTVTSMGARLLHQWLLNPLCDIDAISARHDAIAEWRDEHRLRTELQEILKDAQDLQRLTTRASTARATPRDLAGVARTGPARTLQLLPKLKPNLTAPRAPLLRALEEQMELCPAPREMPDPTLVDAPPQNPRDGNVIRPGYNAELDELRNIARGGKEW